jgi:hypothetical protein
MKKCKAKICWFFVYISESSGDVWEKKERKVW